MGDLCQEFKGGENMVILDKENEKLENKLEELLLEDLFAKAKDKGCPHCQNGKVIKYGNYKNVQRYMCKICGRTFSKRTFTPFYYSKKSPSLWVKYIELMIENNTLKECSEKLDIDLGTAFYWRHKILNSLMKVREPNRLDKYIEMAKIYIKENFKGSRMPKQEERETIWTIIAADSEEKIVARPICKVRWDINAFNKIIYSRISKDSYLIGRGDRFLWTIERNHNKGKEVIVNDENILMDYFRTIKIGMRRYYGVATKYLTHYLYFLTIFCVEKSFDALSLFYKLIVQSSYIENKEFKKMQLKL